MTPRQRYSLTPLGRRLAADHVRLAYRVFDLWLRRRGLPRGHSRDDLEAVALESWCAVVANWDQARGRLSTAAYRNLPGYLDNHVARAARAARRAVPLTRDVGAAHAGFADADWDDECRARGRRARAHLWRLRAGRVEWVQAELF